MATVITTLSQLKDACSSGGTYELGADISSVAVTVASGKTLYLDLKTYTLTGTGSSSSVITVSGTLDLSGTTGRITNGKASYGGGVYVRSGGTFTMSGGSITGNNTTYGGCGVYVTGGTFTMHGGSISANNAGGTGGGVFVTNSGTFTMFGGSIAGNNSQAAGGGICVSSNGTFNVSGSPVIKDNTKAGAANNVYLSRSITITGALTDDAEIYVCYPTGGGTKIGTNTSRYTGVEHILSDDGLYMGSMSGTDVVWFSPSHDVKIRVKTSNGWKTGIVWVKTADGWKKAKAVRVKTSSGWKEAKQI